LPNSSTGIGIGSTPNVANLSCTAGTARFLSFSVQPIDDGDVDQRVAFTASKP